MFIIYNALREERSYREAYTHDKAINIMKEEAKEEKLISLWLSILIESLPKKRYNYFFKFNSDLISFLDFLNQILIKHHLQSKMEFY